MLHIGKWLPRILAPIMMRTSTILSPAGAIGFFEWESEPPVLAP